MADWPKDVKVIAVVTWEDSSGVSGWRHQDAWEKEYESLDLTCLSVGYVIYEDDGRIWLAQSLSAHGSMADAIVIPKFAIRERHEIIPRSKGRPKDRAIRALHNQVLEGGKAS